MRYFSHILYLIQFTFSIALYIPNSDSINFIDNAVKLQDDRRLNESIHNQPTDMLLDIPESDSSNVTTDSSTQPTTATSRETTTTDFLSSLKDHIPILAAIGGGAVLCVIISICICCCCRRRRRAKIPTKRLRSESTSEAFQQDDVPMQKITKKKSSKQSELTQSNPKCPYMRLAKEFVASLGWNKALLDPSYDKCHCLKCYPADYPNVTEAGNAEYVVPRGWARVGLHVDSALIAQHDIWDEWIVTFHGTSLIAAQSILANRQFCLPGDKLIDGTALGIREGHIPNKKHIYTSPTIAYSSLPVYCPTYEYCSSKTNLTYEVQIVLQCRQRPDLFEIQRETIGAGKNRLCRFIPNNRIEYYTEIRSSLIAYGLLVKLEEC